MRKFRVSYVLVITLMLALNSCASIPPPIDKPLPPGYVYKASFLNIRTPEQAGWYLAGASQSGMQFTRRGDEKGETFTALVSTFPLPNIQDADEFLAFIKRAFKDDTEKKRVTIVNLNFNISSARKYLCVNVAAVIEEKQAISSVTQHEGMLIQSISLYCRHPLNTRAGFAIAYSHRGKSLYPDLSKEAKAFIAGVQVPE